jgi:hypothetical protein
MYLAKQDSSNNIIATGIRNNFIYQQIFKKQFQRAAGVQAKSSFSNRLQLKAPCIEATQSYSNRFTKLAYIAMGI